MAELIGTAYIQILPSMKGIRENIAKELDPAAKSVGTNTGATLGKAASQALTQELGADAGPRLSKVMERAAGQGRVSLLTKFKGIGASLADEFEATGKISGTLRTVSDSIGVTGTEARGLAERFRSVQGASTGMGAGLSGVSGILMGPWGAAIAGAGLALNTFITAQENAQRAAEELAATLDAKTGAATFKTFQTNATKFLKEFDSTELARTGFTLDDITSALTKGGAAVTDLQARIEAARKSAVDAAGPLGFREANEAAERFTRLSNAVTNLNNDGVAAVNVSKDQRQALLAAALAANGAGDGFDSLRAVFYENEIQAGATRKQLIALSESTQAQARAAADAERKQSIFQSALDSVARSADDLSARISAIPSDVRITAKSVGINRLIAQANAVAAAWLRATAAMSAANVIKTDGERHGADLGSQSSANRNASQTLGAADDAYRRILKQIREHNRNIPTGGSSKGGGGGARVRTDPLESVKASLGASVSGSFASDLAAEDAKGISRFITKEIALVRKALSGKNESALVSLLKTDNVKLRGLAAQRAAVQKSIADGESRLSDLQSRKASTVTSLRDNALGSLVGARSVSGIKRGLTKQLAKVIKFSANLKTLARRGLPQVFLEQIVAAGLDGAYTADALARASEADFTQIKSLTNSLNTQSSALGESAGSLLYDTGIASMKGLIAGLKSQDKALEEQMLKIAKAMQKAIKKALGIKSPSRVFRGLGVQVPAGMALGIDDGAPKVHRSLDRMAGYRPQAYAPGFNRSGADVTAMQLPPIHVHTLDPVAGAIAAADEIAWRMKGRG